MRGAPSSHVTCCKLRQQIIPPCVNSDGARTATGTWSASTAKSGVTRHHFKKATNLALVLNFTETERLLKSNDTYLQRLPEFTSTPETNSINSTPAERWACGAACLPACWAGQVAANSASDAADSSSILQMYSLGSLRKCQDISCVSDCNMLPLCSHVSVHNCKSWSNIQ